MADSLSPLDRAIALAGSTYKLGRLLGCRQSVVSMWKTRGSVPAERCIAIEAVTAGRVTRYQLRADVFGAAPAPGEPKPVPARRGPAQQAA